MTCIACVACCVVHTGMHVHLWCTGSTWLGGVEPALLVVLAAVNPWLSAACCPDICLILLSLLPPATYGTASDHPYPCPLPACCHQTRPSTSGMPRTTSWAATWTWCLTTTGCTCTTPPRTTAPSHSACQVGPGVWGGAGCGANPRSCSCGFAASSNKRQHETCHYRVAMLRATSVTHWTL